MKYPVRSTTVRKHTFTRLTARLAVPVLFATLLLTACGSSSSSGDGGNNPSNPLGAGPAPVVLGTAGNYVILAKTGISTTGATHIVGDLGLSPAAASYITGATITIDGGWTAS